MKELLNKAKKILITTSQDADFDQLDACICLAHSINKKGKKVSLSIPTDKYAKRVFELFPTENLKLIQKDDPDSFILSLPKNDAIVKDVKWKEEKGNIEIFITTEKGSIPTDHVTLQPHRTLFDLVIVVGIENLEDIGTFYMKNRPLFSKNKVQSIANTPNDFAGQNFVKNCISSSANVFEFLLENNPEIDEKYSTDLLAGFLWKTNGLKYDSKGTTGELLKNFIENQADFQIATKKAFQNIDLADIRMITTILKGMTVKNSTIAYASLKNVKSKGLNPERVTTYDWFVLDGFREIETFFVLFEMPEGVLGYLINKNSRRDARELTSTYKTTGSKFVARFKSSDSLDTTQQNLLQEIDDIKSSDIPKAQNAESENASPNNINNIQAEDSNPLAPATELPHPLQIEIADDGFMPPPPISPLEPLEKQLK